MKSWHCFAFLIVTAITYYYIGKLILLIVGCYLLLRGWLWICRRYPLLAWFLYCFTRGLLGGRRRRW